MELREVLLKKEAGVAFASNIICIPNYYNNYYDYDDDYDSHDYDDYDDYTTTSSTTTRIHRHSQGVALGARAPRKAEKNIWGNLQGYL